MSTAQISFMPLFRRLDRIATELLTALLTATDPSATTCAVRVRNGTPSIAPERPSASHRSMVS